LAAAGGDFEDGLIQTRDLARAGVHIARVGRELLRTASGYPVDLRACIAEVSSEFLRRIEYPRRAAQSDLDAS